MEKKIFNLIRFITALDKSMNSATRPISSCINTTSAVSAANSVPLLPLAIPTVAFANAGASTVELIIIKLIFGVRTPIIVMANY